MDKMKLTFKNTQIRIDDEELTFVIGNIRSRTPSVVYFKFLGYDVRNNLVYTHTGAKWVIGKEYDLKKETFSVTNPTKIDNYTIEMYLIGINSENPLYMTELMLTNKEYTEYHQPNDAINDIKIGFSRNSYVNLYGLDEDYLQIISPNHDDFTTSALLPSKLYILAPHLPNESEYDEPTALFYEYMYQTEQTIGVDK